MGVSTCANNLVSETAAKTVSDNLLALIFGLFQQKFEPIEGRHLCDRKFHFGIGTLTLQLDL